MFAGLIGLLAPRLGAGFAKLIAYVGIPLLLIGLAWWALDSYGDRRADGREREVRAEYQEASNRLKAEAAKSATRADDAAAVRLEQHVEQVHEEQERLDEAQRNGSSPLDVLFGD